MHSHILESFPTGYKPTKSQENLLTNIERAFNEGYKFVVCCAPTGSGKSFIAKTIGNIAPKPSEEFVDAVSSYRAFKKNDADIDVCDNEPPFGAFALTITKSLQDQYRNLFNDINVLKGKSNYQCEIDNNFSVETAPCVLINSIKEDCWTKNICPYYTARRDALTATFSTLNYNMFFSLPNHVKRKEYLICDEASELEDQLVKQFTCTINFDALKRSDISIPPFEANRYDKILRWVGNIINSVAERAEDIKKILHSSNVKDPKLKAALSARQTELSILMNIQGKLSTLVDTWNDSEYLVETDAKGISFIPLKVDKLAKHLFDFGEKVVLMSATIIDPKNFCKSLGITDFKYIEAESTFDPKNAPIYSNTKIRLSFSNLTQNLPKIVKQIAAICEHHKKDKGVIHTHTNYITSYLNNALQGNRFLFREPGANNEKLLNEHYDTNEPTVLVSPSMGFGVDLKDDLARFQILIKAPYLPMKDVRVEKLLKLDKDWYINKMLSAVIQSCGRGIRSKQDHCATYILDGSIVDCIVKNKHKLPKHFLDRFV